jgi:hypothetical protein
VVATVGQGELRLHARRLSMKTVPVADLYYRVADPDWADPLDPSFAAAGVGQRWNPPGLPCLYLHRGEATARANVMRLYAGLPYGPEDLDPATAPLLLDVSLPGGASAAAFTDDGLVELGLPTTYPTEVGGALIPHAACQPVGQDVFDAGLDGVDCRSAAVGGNRELAWFPHGSLASEATRRAFDEWW